MHWLGNRLSDFELSEILRVVPTVFHHFMHVLEKKSSQDWLRSWWKAGLHCGWKCGSGVPLSCQPFGLLTLPLHSGFRILSQERFSLITLPRRAPFLPLSVHVRLLISLLPSSLPVILTMCPCTWLLPVMLNQNGHSRHVGTSSVLANFEAPLAETGFVLSNIFSFFPETWPHSPAFLATGVTTRLSASKQNGMAVAGAPSRLDHSDPPTAIPHSLLPSWRVGWGEPWRWLQGSGGCKIVRDYKTSTLIAVWKTFTQKRNVSLVSNFWDVRVLYGK